MHSFSEMFSFSKCTSIFTIPAIRNERVKINRNNFSQRGCYSNWLDLCSLALSLPHLWSNASDDIQFSTKEVVH